MLNPQSPLRPWGRSYPGAHELFSTGRYSTERSIPKEKAYEEALAATADAYLKDAEKRGIVSSSDDRITKNYKTMNDLIQQKNLKDVKFKSEDTPGAYGEFHKRNNTITVDPDKNNPFEYLKEGKLDTDAVSFAEEIAGILSNKKDSEIYPKMSMSKQKEIQEDKLNKHLNTIIHELRHAEDFKKDPEEKGYYYGHFLDAPQYDWDETKSGKIQDIQAAALQRLSNMGRKKRSE
jgi:hypothetical protein